MFEAAIYGHHSANTWLTWHGPKINPAFTSWWEWRADCWWRRAEGCRDAPNAFELPWVHKPKLSVFSLVSHDEINQKWYHSFLQEQAMEPQPWWVFTASWMGSFWLADQTLNPWGGRGGGVGGFNGAAGAQARGRLNDDASSYSRVFVRCIAAQIRKAFQRFWKQNYLVFTSGTFSNGISEDVTSYKINHRWCGLLPSGLTLTCNFPTLIFILVCSFFSLGFSQNRRFKHLTLPLSDSEWVMRSLKHFHWGFPTDVTETYT